MTKKEFLKILEMELKRIGYKESQSLVDFYDELIEDKMESGKKEKEVISEIGNVQNIIKNIAVEEKIAVAKEKPTLSNGFKALFAVLGVLSLPLLVPMGIVAVALAFALVMLLISLIIVVASGVLSGVAVFIFLIVQVLHYGLPISSFIFGIGVSLVIIGAFLELLRYSVVLPKKLIIIIIKSLEKAINKKKGAKNHD